MSEWWINDSGLNLLKGVEGDDLNPPRLSDDLIVLFLRTIPQSRESFNRLVPSMLEDEQYRLNDLALSAVHMSVSTTQWEDQFQSLMNRSGTRTCGPYGGTRRGGNL